MKKGIKYAIIVVLGSIIGAIWGIISIFGAFTILMSDTGLFGLTWNKAITCTLLFPICLASLFDPLYKIILPPGPITDILLWITTIIAGVVIGVAITAFTSKLLNFIYSRIKK